MRQPDSNVPTHSRPRESNANARTSDSSAPPCRGNITGVHPAESQRTISPSPPYHMASPEGAAAAHHTGLYIGRRERVLRYLTRENIGASHVATSTPER